MIEESPTPDHADASAQDDHLLMARIAEGDHQAFRALVMRYQDVVIGTVAKMLGSVNDAEDIGQQVFLRIWRHAKRYRPDAKFTTYLFTITRNLVFTEIRRRDRKKEVSSDDFQEHAPWQPTADSNHEPDARMIQEELRVAVDQAIATLPETQRMAVILRRYDQLPYDQIAVILGLSVPAVKSLLFRARNELREALSRYMED